MKVRFQRGFFIEGYFFHPHRVTEVPVRFRDRLPHDATILNDDGLNDADAPQAPERQKIVRTNAGAKDTATDRKPAPRRKKQPASPADAANQAATPGAAVAAPKKARRATPVQKAGTS